jgi:hypothetical protein
MILNTVQLDWYFQVISATTTVAPQRKTKSPLPIQTAKLFEGSRKSIRAHTPRQTPR